jgi:glycerate kinase
MTVLTDVATTFGGAASVFAPQKGATPAVVVKDLVPGQGVDSRHGNR